MRHLLPIFSALLLCSAPLHAQTLKSLMYNTTNGQAVANTGTNNLTFNDSVTFEGGITISDAFAMGFETLPNTAIQISDDGIDFNTTNAAATTRANLGFSTNLNTLWTATNASNARSAVGLGLPALTNTTVANFKGATQLQSFRSPDNYAALYWGDTEYLNVEDGVNALAPISFPNGGQGQTRTNLGLGLPAFTNTSNLTTMRALSGSTNTNHPYSGSISVTGTNNTNTLVFSNGILQSVQ